MDKIIKWKKLILMTRTIQKELILMNTEIYMFEEKYIVLICVDNIMMMISNNT